MAFMNQERKKRIQDDLKKVIPADWKWSLKVRNHSTIVLTIRQAPVDLIGKFRVLNGTDRLPQGTMYFGLNPYHWESMVPKDLHGVFKGIFEALNKGNHDRSDLMTDYFDVGWYVDVQIGEWDNPFLCVLKKEKA